MQVFVTINKDGIMINADVNVKNCLIKVVVIKDLFGILVIVSVNMAKYWRKYRENMAKYWQSIGEYLSCKKCKYRKELVDRLVEECTENVDEKEFYPAKLH